jgi:hypothetical protein
MKGFATVTMQGTLVLHRRTRVGRAVGSRAGADGHPPSYYLHVWLCHVRLCQTQGGRSTRRTVSLIASLPHKPSCSPRIAGYIHVPPRERSCTRNDPYNGTAGKPALTNRAFPAKSESENGPRRGASLG